MAASPSPISGTSPTGPRTACCSLAAKEKLSDADAGAIHEVQPNGKGAKLKLYDKQAALDRLARHLGLFDPHARLSPQDQTVDGKAARDELRERLMRHFKKAGTE